MSWEKQKVVDLFYVTDYVANGSFASLRENVTYLYEKDYAILIRTTDNTKGWNGSYVYVNKSSYDFLQKSKLFPNDLIISNVGEPGKAFLCPDLGMPMSLGPNSILVRPIDKKIVDQKFFYYYTISNKGQKQIQEICSATTQKKFNKTSYRNLEIPLPPLATQQKIAEILDAADAYRQQTKALIAKYDELAQSVFLDMFGGNFPSESLGNLIGLKGGGTPSKKIPEYWNGNIYWASVKDLKEDLLKETQDKISSLGLKNSAANLIPKGSIIIGTRMAVGKVAILNVDMAINQDLKGIEIKKNLSTTYLFHFLKNQSQYFEKVSSGATVKGIKINDILSLEVKVPPQTVQEAFSKKIENINSQKQLAQQELQKAEELFNSLMQKAFRGELV